MWSYYGAKTNIVHLYPPPKYGKIIEPFAGTARYALKYFDREVLLVDKYPVIIDIWKWLQQCSKEDILKLPRPRQGQLLSDFTFDCPEAKMLIGFLIAKGVERPKLNKGTDWALIHRPNFTNFSLLRIAANLFKIKHWEIKLGSFEEIENEKATWFIDPPYQVGGKAYVMNSRKIDFRFLANWSRAREGQVIVCENSNSDWMPWIPLANQSGCRGNQNEVFWTNEKTSYSTKQRELF